MGLNARECQHFVQNTLKKLTQKKGESVINRVKMHKSRHFAVSRKKNMSYDNKVWCVNAKTHTFRVYRTCFGFRRDICLPGGAYVEPDGYMFVKNTRNKKNDRLQVVSGYCKCDRTNISKVVRLMSRQNTCLITKIRIRVCQVVLKDKWRMKDQPKFVNVRKCPDISLYGEIYVGKANISLANIYLSQKMTVCM
jgi:hypothetical protein